MFICCLFILSVLKCMQHNQILQHQTEVFMRAYSCWREYPPDTNRDSLHVLIYRSTLLHYSCANRQPSNPWGTHVVTNKCQGEQSLALTLLCCIQSYLHLLYTNEHQCGLRIAHWQSALWSEVNYSQVHKMDAKICWRDFYLALNYCHFSFQLLIFFPLHLPVIILPLASIFYQ